MARRYLMTWKPGEARWRKMHRGQWFAVSCRDLGVAPTKEASWRAANQWWELEKAKADSPTEATDEARARMVKVLSVDHPEMSTEDREAVVDAIAGEGAFRRLMATAESIVGSAKNPTPERTVASRVNAWRTLLHGSCQAGQLSEARFDSYSRDIETFARWVGRESQIDSIDESKIEEFFNHLSARVASGSMSPSYAHGVLMTARQFISRLAEMKLIPIPGNLRSRRFRFNQGRAAKIETFSVDEIRAMLATCEGWSEKTKLYILMSLNAGLYQNDIAELRNDEVDWKAGTMTRARSKMRESGGVVVTYKLWPETLSLLRKHRTQSGDLVLTTGEGNPLVRRWLEDGKMRRYDLIHSAWSRMALKMGMRKNRLGFKHLRKTAASILGTHPRFKYYGPYFLAHAPRSTADRHYILPSDPEFFQALDWLRGEILGSDG